MARPDDYPDDQEDTPEVAAFVADGDLCPPEVTFANLDDRMRWLNGEQTVDPDTDARYGGAYVRSGA